MYFQEHYQTYDYNQKTITQYKKARKLIKKYYLKKKKKKKINKIKKATKI